MRIVNRHRTVVSDRKPLVGPLDLGLCSHERQHREIPIPQNTCEVFILKYVTGRECFQSVYLAFNNAAGFVVADRKCYEQF